VGFLFSLMSVAALSSMIPAPAPAELECDAIEAVKELASPPLLPSPVKPTVIASSLLLLATIFKGQITIVILTKKCFGVSSTISSYLLATKLPAKIRKVFHPVLACAATTAMLHILYGFLTQTPWTALLQCYFGSGMNGAGDLISYVLGPVIISFGLQLYVYRKILKKNAMRTVGTTFFAGGTGLLSSAILANLMKLAPREAALAPLTRCITSPLALAGSAITGADPSLAAFVVAITGILGASFGESILEEKMSVRDEITSGLTIGATAHGLGAAAVATKPVKFAAAVVSMTLTGLWTVVLLSVPVFRNLLIKIALG
jgi:putative effector of murein hydrolase